MSPRSWCVVVMGLWLSGGCGGDPDASSGAALAYDYEMQEVALTESLVIPEGDTVRVGPGVTFSAKSADVKIEVFGTLIVEGSDAAPAVFAGGGEPESWHGIVVERGGSLTLEHAQISGAKYGMFAKPGSSFSVAHAVIDTSFKAAVVQSDGTISHSTFKAVPLFPAVTEAVTVDDPNGCLTIMDASPTVSHCLFEGSGGLNDMVRVGGEASPVFDHIHVHSSHCGFHMSGGTNTAPRISNTIFENLAYGIMAFQTKPIVESSVFRQNATDIGLCNGATEDNTPMLQGNFFAEGALRLDASCDRIGTVDTSPAASANPEAGPSGL